MNIISHSRPTERPMTFTVEIRDSNGTPVRTVQFRARGVAQMEATARALIQEAGGAYGNVSTSGGHYDQVSA